MPEERAAPSTPASAGGTSPPPAAGAASASVASRCSKAADSACSVGNSQSQRSGSGSSKSRISNSSGSSGYGGHPSTLSSGVDAFPQPRCRDKDHRKKKLKAEQGASEADAPAATATAAVSGAEAPLPSEEDAAVATPAPELPEAAGADAQAAGAAPTASPATASTSSNEAAEVESAPADQEQPCGETGGFPQQRHAKPQQPASDNKDEFTVVVSMQDGAVIYTSPSITQALAFPRDMWVGKSFIDYVHPDDRLALIQHITTGVALPRRKGGSGESPAKAPAQAPLFCRLRRYPSLRDGFAVAERRLVHRPFSLQLSFYELPASTSGAAPAALPPGVLLTVTATAVCSAYSRPDEKPVSGSRFATRHQADGKLTHVDGEAVSLLGYLPQQLLGRPIFDVYHPADLRGLQRVYCQLVSKECESPLRGQPYRLRTHNGCYVRVHTEWSSFVNPWTKRLEFVVGQHCILQGPSCPDVFAEVQDEEMFSEELLQDSKAAQTEILQLLQEEVHRREPGLDRRDVSRRCKDLASFMETLIGEISEPKLRVDPAAAAAKRIGANFSERSSVTLGEISPHRDYYDSKSSSETPPSYNQLNYDDNIQRFFESKPKTIPSDDSGERLMALEPTSRSTDEDTKAATVASGCRATRNCLSPVNDTGSGSNSGSGSGSAGPSAKHGSVDTAEADGDYKPPQLTEALLSRHNEDMEKKMVQRHREQRSKGGDGKCKRLHHCQVPALLDDAQVESSAPPATASQALAGVAAHGTKRSGSHSWDGEPLKASKHSHAPSPPAAPPPPVPPREEAPPLAAAPGPPPVPSPAAANAKDVGLSLWPPFSVAVTPQSCSARENLCSGGCCGGRSHAHAHAHAHVAPQLLPLYYLPAPAGSGGRPHQQPHAPAAYLQQQGGALPYVAAGVLYQAAPLLYPLAPPPPPPPSHLLALHQPLVHHQPSAYQLTARGGMGVAVSLPEPAGQQSAAAHHHCQQRQPTPLPRPASCATSVKVEPGSSVASVAASVLNRGASDGSQKCCRTSGEEETEAEDSGSGSGLRGRGQSSSSYTYSFLRSDGDSCRDADGAAAGAEDMLWERMENGSSEGTSKRRPVLKDPPWLENVEVTPDLMFRYQMSKHELDTVLKDDLQKLRAISQPMLVNEQLGQLYLDMARSTGSSGEELRLEEGELTSSSCGSGNDSAGTEGAAATRKTRKKRRSLEYSKLVMIFEENAPMPSPLPQPA